MKRVFLLASVLFLLAACAGKPIYNVDRASVATSSGATPSMADVRGAIIRAANSKHWTTKDIDTTHLLVTHVRNKRMASVVVEYSTTFFSITYKDSRKLKYKGETIHRKYNGWIRNLEFRIREYLAEL